MRLRPWLVQRLVMEFIRVQYWLPLSHTMWNEPLPFDITTSSKSPHPRTPGLGPGRAGGGSGCWA